MIVPPEIENEDFCHVVWIAKAGAQNEKKNGLTHLTEHTCLVPAFLQNRSIGEDNLKICGITCLHYFFLYIAAPLEYQYWLDEWIHSVLSSEVVTEKNVSIAKHQISCECKALQKITEMRRLIINFVSDGKIKALPIGTLESINEVSVQEVKTCLMDFHENDLHQVFSFRSAIELWKQYPKAQIYADNNPLEKTMKRNNSFNQDKVLNVTSSSVNNFQVEYFFSLPETHNHDEYLKIIYLESLLDLTMEKIMPLPFKVSEKFFSKQLGFLSIRICPPDDFCFREHFPLEWIQLIREKIFIQASEMSFFDTSKKHIAECISQIRHHSAFFSTSECLAQIVSNMVYERPMYDFDQKEYIWSFLDKMDISIVRALREFILSPARIVVYMPQ